MGTSNLKIKYFSYKTGRMSETQPWKTRGKNQSRCRNSTFKGPEAGKHRGEFREASAAGTSGPRKGLHKISWRAGFRTIKHLIIK